LFLLFKGEEGLDSDDDDDLAERLEGVDLDDADQVWSQLTADERAEFERMCSSGKIEDLVPEFVPWDRFNETPFRPKTFRIIFHPLV
jgi:hypothetical protein